MPRANPHTCWLLYGPGPHSRSAFLEEGVKLAAQSAHTLSLAADLFEAAKGVDKAVEATREAVEKADTACKAALAPRYQAAMDEVPDWKEKHMKDGYLKTEAEDTDINTEQGFPPHDRSPPETPPPEKRWRRRFKSKPGEQLPHEKADTAVQVDTAHAEPGKQQFAR